MRIYFLETLQEAGNIWTRGAKSYLSCAKAHRLAKNQQAQGKMTRVLMLMQKRSLKDLSLALQGQARHR